MDEKQNTELVASILTLSQGVDALHEVLRKTLSFQAELHENKILERFIPPALDKTDDRFYQWKKSVPEND